MTSQELQKYQDFQLSGKLHGTTVSRLDEKKSIEPYDLFIFSRKNGISSVNQESRILDEYYDGVILLEEDDKGNVDFLENEESETAILYSDCSSYAITYNDLCTQTVGTARDKIFLGSMAFEDKNDYARKDHDHDDIYTRFGCKSQSSTQPGDKTWKLMTIHLSNFTPDGQVIEETIDITAPSVLLPKFEDETVGNLRFIGIGNLGTDVISYGDIKNVDIFSDSFDGWVYPNGATFHVSTEEFLSACQTYGNGAHSTEFTVPDLRSFVKLNPGTEKYNSMKYTGFVNGLPRHVHDSSELKIEGTPTSPKMAVGIGGYPGSRYICGYGNQNKPLESIPFTVTGNFSESSLNNVRSASSDKSLDVESKPTHNLMPVMVYIGKRRV